MKLIIKQVMAYYISFLKTLSFRLNKHTIHFFYNEHTNDFPLYTEAIKFFNHGESMVRIAVRTLSLNVYRVEDEAMLKFVTDKTAAPYFSNLVWFIGNHILEIDNCVRNDADHNSLNKLKDIVAGHIDHLHYINDILGLNITALNRILSDHLLNRLFIPLYIYSFARNHIPAEDMRPFVSPVVALFLLCQVFLIITHVPLVRLLAWIIVAGDMEVFTERGATLYATSPRRGCRSKPSFMAPPDSLDKLLAKTIRETQEEDEDSDLEEIGASSVSELTKLPSPFHLPRLSSEPPGEDLEDPSLLSITDEEKEQRLAANASFSLENRYIDPYTVKKDNLINALDFTGRSLALCLQLWTTLTMTTTSYFLSASSTPCRATQASTGKKYCIQLHFIHPYLLARELLESVQIPSQHSPSASPAYNRLLVEKMIRCRFCDNKSVLRDFVMNTFKKTFFEPRLATAGCQYGSRVRLVTLEILIISLKMIVTKVG